MTDRTVPAPARLRELRNHFARTATEYTADVLSLIDAQLAAGEATEQCDCPVGPQAHHVLCSAYGTQPRCGGRKRVVDLTDPRSTTPCPGCVDCAEPAPAAGSDGGIDGKGLTGFDIALTAWRAFKEKQT